MLCTAAWCNAVPGTAVRVLVFRANLQTYKYLFPFRTNNTRTTAVPVPGKQEPTVAWLKKTQENWNKFDNPSILPNPVRVACGNIFTAVVIGNYGSNTNAEAATEAQEIRKIQKSMQM